jgi:hypothetical protein
MERFFILGNKNTWYDWRLYLTAKDIPDAERKANYVDIDGMHGTLDLSESLTGEVKYNDRTITASFWTDNGNRKDRDALLRSIVSQLHGKKIKIIEPDDPDHYFYGRVTIKSKKNILPYAELTLEAICEPWRYAINESSRRVEVKSKSVTDVVINNNGVKTLCPTITITGSVNVIYNGFKTSLTAGTYKFSDVKLYQGVNIIGVSGNGSVTITYTEADL